jgi:hypothetical protein
LVTDVMGNLVLHTYADSRTTKQGLYFVCVLVKFGQCIWYSSVLSAHQCVKKKKIRAKFGQCIGVLHLVLMEERHYSPVKTKG